MDRRSPRVIFSGRRFCPLGQCPTVTPIARLRSGPPRSKGLPTSSVGWAVILRRCSGRPVSTHVCSSNPTCASRRRSSCDCSRSPRSKPGPRISVCASRRCTVSRTWVRSASLRARNTVGEAMQTLIDYLYLHNSATHLRIDDNGRSAVIGVFVETDTTLPAPDHRLAVGAAVGVLRSFRRRVKPLSLQLAYAAPARDATHRRVYGCPIEFDAPPERAARRKRRPARRWNRPRRRFSVRRASGSRASPRAQGPDGFH